MNNPSGQEFILARKHNKTSPYDTIRSFLGNAKLLITKRLNTHLIGNPLAFDTTPRHTIP